MTVEQTIEHLRQATDTNSVDWGSVQAAMTQVYPQDGKILTTLAYLQLSKTVEDRASLKPKHLSGIADGLHALPRLRHPDDPPPRILRGGCGGEGQGSVPPAGREEEG